MRINLKVLGIILIFIGILGIIIIIDSIKLENKGINNWNAVETQGEIYAKSEIIVEPIYRDYLFHLFKQKYSREIYYFYKDDIGNTYDSFFIYSTKETNPNEINSKYEIGDKIKITYQKDNPSNSIKGNVNIDFYKVLIGIILLFIILFGIYLIIQRNYKYFYDEEPIDIGRKHWYEGKSLKINFEFKFIITIFMIAFTGNAIVFSYLAEQYIVLMLIGIVLFAFVIKKIIINILEQDLKLKVVYIESIDYEREKVFFESDNKKYFFETDFGEDFILEKEYQIKLKLKNLRKVKNENTYVIEIIGIEKRKFKALL
ncbi:MAG: hypothetical protein IKF52_00600 [Clostridia bacterium]|nr:hypothetical protein [Clostridia bacterium]